MSLIDTHAHLDFYDAPAERLEVLRRAKAAGVDTILAIGIGQGPDEMHHALEMAKSAQGDPTLPRLFASAGIHPEQAHNANPEALERLATLAAHPLCIAIGEIGLDYYHLENPDIATQQQAFIAQMQIASTLRKPILIHCRTSELATPQAREKYGTADAWHDVLTLIREHWAPHRLGGIMHCFSGTPGQAILSVAAGFYVSFAGNLTYPKSDSIRESALAAPKDRILIETDCPFLAPLPYRGQRNEPALITHTAAVLADLRGLSLDELASRTTRNFRNLFPATA